MARLKLDFGGSTLGQRLFTIRRRAGLTQEDLADSAGVTRAYISLIERDLRVPTVELTVTLAQAIGVPVADLLAEVLSTRTGRDLDVTRNLRGKQTW